MRNSRGRAARLATGVLSALFLLGASPPPAAAQPQVLAIRPVSGPAAGGTNISIYGTDFAAGAAVTIGDVAAVGVSLADATTLGATIPALEPGSVNDVVVTVPGSEPVILPGAWFARFLDVPPTHLFAKPIERLRRMGITSGCVAGNYCPEDPVTRAQMAIFILRGEHGSTYRPPPATGTIFTDVPATAFGADWIEQFAGEGITTGCGGGRYCPNNSVTRGEMAVFLLRARHGSTHNPPPPTGVFHDVPVGTTFGKWIEELAGEAITTGCGGGNYCPNGPSTRGQMAVFLTKAFARSRQDMIEEDLAADDLDYETSLLYRFYAVFSDPRLPAKYQPAPGGEDSGLFEEVRLVLPDLSPAGQAALAPFLARPDDPASLFGPSSAPLSERRPDDGGVRCANAWTELSGAHFKVHLCESGNAAADASLRSSVSAAVESLWSPMTAGMGSPPGDCYTPPNDEETCPGGDNKIDVYILNTNQCYQRNGNCWSLEAYDAGALASSCPPFAGKKSSGYIMIRKDEAANAGSVKSILAHEFFHVLQFAHNATAAGIDTGTTVHGRRVIASNWYVESSATWAEWQYVPATAFQQVHSRFLIDFEPSHASLLAYAPRLHPYSAYIWSFFAEQEKGGPSPVFNAWVGAEGASNSGEITDAVDQQMLFIDHFRDFAVRNWNKELPGNPISPLYRDLKASDGSTQLFPHAQPPVVARLNVTPTSPRTQKQHVKLESLSARYDTVTVDPDVKKVILRFDKLPDSFDADLLVQMDSGTWERRRVDRSVPVGFCRDKAAEKVNQIVIITSNHSKAQGHFGQGDYTIERRASCCTELGDATSFEASVSFSYTHTGDLLGDSVHANESATLTAHLTKVLPPLPDSISFESSTVTGAAHLHDKIVYSGGDSVAADGDGSPVNATVTLSVDLVKCTCRFAAGSYVNVTTTPPGTSSGPGGIGGADGEAIDVASYADKIAGSAPFPAHSGTWAAGHPGQSVYLPGGLGLLFFADPSNEDLAGSAGVTWSFTPNMPP